MPLGEEGGVGKLLGTSCKEILKKRPSNFYWNCKFSLLFSLLTQFALIFFAVWNVPLPCEQSEKTHFFRFKARTKIPKFSLIFALSEDERHTLLRTLPVISGHCL